MAELFGEGVERGADRLCFCDTVGLLTPERAREVVPPLAALAPLSIHCHDDLGFALATTVAALQGGATCAHATVNGLGERAGNTAFEALVMALETLYGYETGIETRKLYPLSALVSRLTKVPLATQAPVAGEMAFTHESGIHAHGVLARPRRTSRSRPRQWAGRAGSCWASTRARPRSRPRSPSAGTADEVRLAEIVRPIKGLGDQGKRVTNAELLAIAEAVLAIECTPVLSLRQFTVVSGSNAIPTASVTIRVNGDEITSAATGTGPVDAAVEALRRSVQAVGEIELLEYHVDAISGGTDALVDVTVKMAKDGKMITSRGARTDIITASVEAVVAGMNRLLRD